MTIPTYSLVSYIAHAYNPLTWSLLQAVHAHRDSTAGYHIIFHRSSTQVHRCQNVNTPKYKLVRALRCPLILASVSTQNSWGCFNPFHHHSYSWKTIISVKLIDIRRPTIRQVSAMCLIWLWDYTVIQLPWSVPRPSDLCNPECLYALP